MARKVDAKKEEEKRLQALLLDMLKEEENKYCADCQAKTPRSGCFAEGRGLNLLNLFTFRDFHSVPLPV